MGLILISQVVSSGKEIVGNQIYLKIMAFASSRPRRDFDCCVAAGARHRRSLTDASQAAAAKQVLAPAALPPPLANLTLLPKQLT